MTMNAPSSASAAQSRAAARSLPLTVARESGLAVAGALVLTLVGQIALPLPFTPVPITLGTFAALAVGGVMGSRRAIGSVAIYAAAAALNVPVLAGWTGGAGLTFGYVLGYALAGAVAGLALSRTADGARRPVPVRVGLMLAASALIYVPGLLWLKAFSGADWGTVLTAGMLPFLLGDALKSVAAAFLPTLPTRR